MITGVVSEADYVAACSLHRRGVAIAINWVLGTVAAVGLVLAIVGVRPLGVILFLGGICGLIGEAVQARLYLPGQARKFYSQFKGIEAPIPYRWSAEKFSVHSERGNSERNWEDLLKVKENDRVLLLYTTDALFEVVPKRVVSNSAALGVPTPCAEERVMELSLARAGRRGADGWPRGHQYGRGDEGG